MTGAAELPVGVTIRTPPSSPSGQLAVIEPPAGLRSVTEHVVLVSQGISSQVNSSSWDATAAHPEPTHVDTSTSQFRHLRSNIPFNRFMPELLNLGTLYREL